ncbi:MAG: nuclear transport factor 2 family protein [Nocardioidaceae bacterium]
MKTPREIADSYWSAECARDLDAVLEHYHPDAIVQPPSGPRMRGRAEIASFYVDEMRDYPGLEVRIVHELSADDEAALEWEAVLTDRQGVRHPFRGVNIVRTSDGMFSSVRAYFDPAAIDSIEQAR